MTDIILVGCGGKMGRKIAECIASRDDCKIVAGVDINGGSFDFPSFKSISEVKGGDVIIDFSHPSSLPDILEYSIGNKIPAVIATTGLSDSDILNIKEASKLTPIFFTFNMSLGVNLLASLAKTASKVLGDAFDIEIVEKHHNQKIDAPSGTAIMLGNAINQENDGKYNFVYDRHAERKKRDKNEIGFSSIRGGNIVGDHDVIFAGEDEVVTLSHSAYSKAVFATGAINAAIYLKGKSAGLYDMSDLVSNK